MPDNACELKDGQGIQSKDLPFDKKDRTSKREARRLAKAFIGDDSKETSSGSEEAAPSPEFHAPALAASSSHEAVPVAMAEAEEDANRDPSPNDAS